MVRLLRAGKPQIGYLVPAVRLQFAAGAYSCHEPIKPNTQNCPGMIGWRSQRVAFQLHTQFLLVLAVQGVEELGYETGGMIQWQQLIKRWRKQPSLRTAHVSKRHLPDSSHRISAKCTLRLLRRAAKPKWDVHLPDTGKRQLGLLDRSFPPVAPTIKGLQ